MLRHIPLVLGADGLGATEAMTLVAMLNHTDESGYAWAGNRLLAAEAHLTVRGLQTAKTRLRAKGLLVDVPHRRASGAQTTNHYLIDVELLRSMQRTQGPDEPVRTPIMPDRRRVHEVHPPHERGAPPGGAPGALLESSSDESSSSLPSSAPVPADAGPASASVRSGGDEETGSARVLRTGRPEHADIAQALALELPGGVNARQAERIIPFLCAGFSRGWAPSAVKRWLASRCDLTRAADPGAVHLRNARLLADPSAADRQGADLELCTRCDEAGRTRDPGAVTRDPGGDRSLCLHGAPDPWDDPEVRRQLLEARREALEAAQAARRRARRLREEELHHKAVKQLTEAGERALRCRAAREYLKSAPSLGSEDADQVLRMMLEAYDPPPLDEIEDMVGIAMSVVDSGVSMEMVEAIVDLNPRKCWRSRLIAKIPVLEES